MLKQLVASHVSNTHHWRANVKNINELSELYASMMLRTLANSLIAIFVPIYLYGLGYSVAQILLFYFFFSITRIPFNFIAGYVVARIGPKHTIAISTIVRIVYLVMLVTQPTLWWPLFVIAVVLSFANALFFTAYHVDFSKIKHEKHGGKELATMTFFQKSGSLLAPLVGGLIAARYEPRITILASIILFIVSLVPLFMSKEPVRTHQKIVYDSFHLPIKEWRNTLVISAFSTYFLLMLVAWPLYLSLAIFTDDPYTNIGFVTTVGALASIVTAQLVGRWVDRGQSKLVLKAGVAIELVLGFYRLFVGSTVGVVSHNIAQSQSQGFLYLPIVKNWYKAADSYPGKRIAFIVWTTVWEPLAWSSVLITAYIMALNFDPISTLKILVVTSALIASLSLLSKYEEHKS